MALPEILKAHLVSELRTAAEMMDKSDDYQAKVYYLSVPFGAVQRVFNIEYSQKWVHLWVILRTTHGSLAGRLEAMKAGTHAPLQIPAGAFDAVSRLLIKLADRIESNEDYVDLLEGLSSIAYSADGNGYYLHSIGQLRYE